MKPSTCSLASAEYDRIPQHRSLDQQSFTNPYKNGYVQHVCCAYGAVNAAHVQAALMCRTCASFCHTSYMRNMYATCVRDMRCLHTCMLQVCCTSVSCMYAYYYSAAYMPLAHMQATDIPHMCILHTCICKLLQCCIHAASHIMIFIFVDK